MLRLHENYSNKNKFSKFVHNCKQIISLKKPPPSQAERNELQGNRYQAEHIYAVQICGKTWRFSKLLLIPSYPQVIRFWRVSSL